MTSGLVYEIQPFCTHDGPGIRTTVFLKGCPLSCAWCHNPEGRSPHQQLFYNSSLCISCGRCVKHCPSASHLIEEGMHCLSRENCEMCLQCAEVCPTGAMEVCGRRMSVDDVIERVLKDRVFFEASGGGLTLSGGEPSYQFDFSKALLSSAKAAGVHTCIETCGYASEDVFRELLPHVDLFLWDIKDTDHERHLTNTGVEPSPIHANLRALDSLGAKTILRCIIIKNSNLTNTHIDGIASIYRGLKNCQGVELLPYNDLAGGKASRLGITIPSSNGFSHPSSEEIAEAESRLNNSIDSQICRRAKY